MATGKEEGKIQKDWTSTKWGFSSHGFRLRKTHEILSSGKPDLRAGTPNLGQLDIELKHKTTTHLGTKTGLTELQYLCIKGMNEYGMPAVGVVWSEVDKKFFITLEREECCGELPTWRWIRPVVKRMIDPVALFLETRRLLSDYGYPSARYIGER